MKNDVTVVIITSVAVLMLVGGLGVAEPVGLASHRVTVQAAETLGDIRAVDDLKDRFNRDAGQVRLVMLVSPT